MPVNLLSAGGGTTTLTTASSASNFTVTIPAETGTMVTTANVPTPAALSTASGSAPSYSARAWVNFNGTGTIAIRASGNVSSLVDNNTGDYTINFTTAMSDVNYCAVGSKGGGGGTGDGFGQNIPYLVAPTTSAIRIGNWAASGVFTDAVYVYLAIFR